MRDLLSSAIRGEMRKRVDEILEAGKAWNKTAENLTNALTTLAAAIEKREEAPEMVTPIMKMLTNLSGKTSKLVKAFNNHTRAIEKITAKV